MKERKSYQLAALGAGLMLLVSIVAPFTGFFNYLLGIEEAWWVLVLLVPHVLLFAGWLLQIPFVRMVRVRFPEQPSLWRYGMAAILIYVLAFLLSALNAAFPSQAGEISPLSGRVLLVYLLMLCSTAAMLLYSYFFTQLFTFCRRVQSRSALTFLPMAAAFLLLLPVLINDIAFFMESPSTLDHSAYFIRNVMNVSCTFIARMLLLIYYSVNIFKARS